MDVVLDTSVIIPNFFFKGRDFDTLFKYLDKTKSKLLIPKIVYLELKQNYKEEASEYLERRKKEDSNLFQNPKAIEELNSMESKYEKFLDKKIKFEILNHDNIHLDELIDNAINKIPPFSSKRDSGFKDTVLWYSIDNFVTKHCNKSSEIAFISENKSDFGDGSLHKNLQEDIDGFCKFYYFNKLGDFLSNVCKQVEFINKEFLEESLNEDDFLIRIMARWAKFSNFSNEIKKYLKSEKMDENFLNYDVECVKSIIVNNFYIFKTKGNKHYASVNLKINFSIILSYYKNHWENITKPIIIPIEDSVELEINEKDQSMKILFVIGVTKLR